MPFSNNGIRLKFKPLEGDRYQVDLEGSQGEHHRSEFDLPYGPGAWVAILRALEPSFDISQADDPTRKVLQPLKPLDCLHETVGKALGKALFADDNILTGFDEALREAEAAREPLPVELRFDEGCDTLAALPWELLHHHGRFLVADSSICLSRWPARAAPPTPALAPLPLRVLLVLSEPLDASPILPGRAREQLVHGLRALDEEGAVIVDLLRPPTYDTLVEAVRNGGYHMLVFYGHGVYDPDKGGHLLFEDPFGGGTLVKASELGAALRNTEVRLVLLGACQSAQVSERGGVWSGTAPTLLQAGVPLVIGMQVSMRVDAAQAFIRQFALSLAAGKRVSEAVADARTPLIRAAYGEQWFVPALYGRPADVDRLFDETTPLPEATADLRAEMKALRVQMAGLERAIGAMGVAHDPGELAQLRSVRRAFAAKRAELARRIPGGYTQVTSPLYGVPSNPVFVGRSEELHEVVQGLHGEHPVVVWGTAGIGKTALAIEAAHRQSWRFPAGVLWLDCRRAPPLDTLLNRIGAFCGVEGIEQVEPDKKESRVRGALALLDGRCLLIWDNVEAVWGNRAVRQFVRERLPDNCQSLLTTRENSEQPMWRTVELRPLADRAMGTLFHRLAEARGVKVGGQVDLDAIPQVIDWLQGHPLAMMLVVPLMAKRGIRRVWGELQKRPLKGIEAAFALSYERLTALQQRLFARLSVFAIPVEWEAAEALLPDDDEVQVADALDMLVQRALVVFDGARYAYHPLLRQYAYEKLEEMEDPRPVHRLAAEYLGGKLKEEGGTPEEGLEETDQWERAEAWEQFAGSASALVGSLDRLGYWEDIEDRLKRALEVAQDHLAEPGIVADLLHGLGSIAWKRTNWDWAIEMLGQSMEMYERLDDARATATTRNTLALVYVDKGEWHQAINMYQQNLDVFGQLGDTNFTAQTWGNLASVYSRTGEWDLAIEMYEKSIETFERLEDMEGMAQTWGNMGVVYHQKGEWDEAIEMYQQSLKFFERLDDVRFVASIWANLGNVYFRKGKWDLAVQCYHQSLEASERIGDVRGMAYTWTGLGLLYANKGEWDEAIEMYQQSLETFERVGDIHGMTQVWTNLGSVYSGKGDWNRAVEMFQESLETLDRLGDVRDIVRTRIGLGLLHIRRGEWNRALKMLQLSLRDSERTGDVHGVALTRMHLGLLYLQQGEWDRAMEMLQQSLEVFERLGDTQRMAQTLGNLGSVYRQKGDLDQAIEMYQRSLEILKRLRDFHSMAQIWANLGTLHQQQGHTEQAARYTANAYAAFGRLGAVPEAQRAAGQLVDILGSVDAANAYLRDLTDEV